LIKQLTTVSEFDEWQAYFEERMSYSDKSDYYAAATIRAIFASQGAKVSRNVGDFLLDFKTPNTRQTNTQDSRSIWFRILGMEQETE
jgi:hypothetical protein